VGERSSSLFESVRPGWVGFGFDSGIWPARVSPSWEPRPAARGRRIVAVAVTDGESTSVFRESSFECFSSSFRPWFVLHVPAVLFPRLLPSENENDAPWHSTLSPGVSSSVSCQGEERKKEDSEKEKGKFMLLLFLFSTIRLACRPCAPLKAQLRMPIWETLKLRIYKANHVLFELIRRL
jgi:hypothetical protein